MIEKQNYLLSIVFIYIFKENCICISLLLFLKNILVKESLKS
jgi:hypothetical protein